MIKTELDFVYITKDGKKFLDRDQAENHQETLVEPKHLVAQLLDKMKGEWYEYNISNTIYIGRDYDCNGYSHRIHRNIL